MRPLHKPVFEHARRAKQRGVVLFFALIALVAMSLAAVALIRSVDTSTMIAGNLAFKQGATNAADAGVEAAITWLATTEAQNATLDVYTDASHPFNNTGGIVNALGSFVNNGYHSNVDPNLDLTDSSALSHVNWDGTNSTCLATDANGNTTCYVIQRMCRDANQLLPSASCLFSGFAPTGTSKMSVLLPQEVCPTCPPPAQPPQYRITARTEGPKNSVSYVQAFVF